MPGVSVPDDIEAEGSLADRKRIEVGKAAYDLNVQQYCCGGLNFGYFYDRSPIIKYDGEPPPAYSMYDFTSSTVPGCRTPHFWLRDGRSLYDVMGNGYALLRFDQSVDITPLINIAVERQMPLRIVDVTPEEAGEPYRERLVLSRPDQHIAWRGDETPADPTRLIDTVTGARTP